MKPLHYFSSDLLCAILLATFLLSGCKRDIPPLPVAELRDVTFKLRGFEAEITPLEAKHSTALMAGEEGIRARGNIEPSPEPQYLYYWSFNDETLAPDIAVDEVGVEIAFEANSETAGFINGRALVPFEAGRALAITGAQSLIIRFPMRDITSLTDFSFDIKSSDTGPKAFSFSYSVDEGTTYEEWSASNQFEKTGSSQWNSYTFDVGDYPELVETEILLFKLDFLQGDRGSGSGYNETSGVVHLDNIRLSGVYNAADGNPTNPTTLQYYIFSADDGSVVQQAELSMEALGSGNTLDVKLADGEYDVLFLAYRSEKGLRLPGHLTNASEFYVGQHFDDYRAVTYAALLDGMVVAGDNDEAAATLARCYSRVEFDFTDLPADLQRVKKIEIARVHDDFLYRPLGSPSVAPSDAERIEFSNFSNPDNHPLVLHQFFGLLDETGEVTYEVTAYGESDTVLNTVTITYATRNNVALRLRGRLLGDTGAINGFSIALDTEWGESVDHDF